MRDSLSGSGRRGIFGFSPNDLNNILGFVAQLNEVDTSNVEPLASVTGHKLPLRNDEVTDGNIGELVLQNAPETSSGFFVVPKVIE